MCHLEYVAIDDDIVKNIQIGFTLKIISIFSGLPCLLNIRRQGRAAIQITPPSGYTSLGRFIPF